jgi:hypothetical protein
VFSARDVKAMAAAQVIKTAAMIENLFISGTSERNAKFPAFVDRMIPSLPLGVLTDDASLHLYASNAEL